MPYHSVEQVYIDLKMSCIHCSSPGKVVPDKTHETIRFEQPKGGFTYGYPLKRLNLCYYHYKKSLKLELKHRWRE